MRCCRRSITLRDRVLAVAMVTVLAWGAPPLARASEPADLIEALRAAMQARLGGRVEIEVSDVIVRWSHRASPGRDIRAALEPNQRFGRPVRFSLHEEGPDAAHGSVGVAQARVRTRVPVVRVATDVARGATITAGNVHEVWEEPNGLFLRPLPQLREVVGTQATRSLRPARSIATRWWR